MSIYMKNIIDRKNKIVGENSENLTQGVGWEFCNLLSYILLIYVFVYVVNIFCCHTISY